MNPLLFAVTSRSSPQEEYNKHYDKLFAEINNLTESCIKECFFDVLYEVEKLKGVTNHRIYELIMVLKVVYDALVSWNQAQTITKVGENKVLQMNIQKLVKLSNEINGKPSFKNKSLGILIMVLAVGLILTALSMVLLVAIGVVPSLGTSVLVSLFGISPTIAGINLFRYGYNTFKSGCPAGLAKKTLDLANTLRCN